MTDLHARLAETLRQHCLRPLGLNCECWRECANADDWANHAADVLLSLPGVAVVELPEGRVRDVEITRWTSPLGPVTRWRGLVQSPLPIASPAEARAFAAALLAAADAAEEAKEAT